MTTNPQELGAHAMEGSDQPDFARKVKKGDLIVAGENFGCGSSREHAPVALVGAGVACVIAKSFARIFFRNAINIGLPLLQCPNAVEGISQGDEVGLDLATGKIWNLSGAMMAEFYAQPMPEFMRAIFDAGGLVEFARRRLQKQ